MFESAYGCTNVQVRWRCDAIRICALLLAVCFATLVRAQSANLVTTPVSSADRVILRDHHPSWANAQSDAGALPADMPLQALVLVLSRTPEREQAFEQFLKDQQNPSSPDFHHWLTPVEIGQRFGVSAHDIAAVKSWLESQGLHLDSVSSSMVRIRFSGSASAVGNAFGSEMHYYMVNAEKRISISGEAQIPSALSTVIHSVTGLFTLKSHPMSTARIAHASVSNVTKGGRTLPAGTFTCGSATCNFVAPADFATIYQVNAAYADGLTGAGQTIAIVGRSDVNPADISTFQMRTGLPQVAPTVIVPPGGVTPPPPDTTKVANPSLDQLEATLDVTRAGSVATGAVIKLVISGDSSTVDGVAITAEYVVDTTPLVGQIMNISFGACESAAASGVPFWNNLFQQAAGEGISVFVASGDSGAAGCDPYNQTPPPTQAAASPNYICSSSYATCVGGTEFADSTNQSTYWSSANSSVFGSAISYIPEGAWNEPTTGSGSFQASSTGGGVSLVIPTPPWQTGVGVPVPSTGRYTPDVAFTASEHDGYFGCSAAGGGSCVGTNGFSFELFAGTSAAAPDMAGIAALLDQFENSAEGNLNPILYKMAVTTSLHIFNDVTVASSGVSNCVVTTPSICNNSTPSPTTLIGGLSGFLVGAGFDEATGLGSLNTFNFISNWDSFLVGTTPSTVALVSSQNPAPAGTPLTFTATVTTTAAFGTGFVEFKDGPTTIGKSQLISSSSSGTTFVGTSLFMTPALTAGSHSITAVYDGDMNFLPGTSNVISQAMTGNNPVPIIYGADPDSAVIGQPIAEFSVSGNHLISGAALKFGTTTVPSLVSADGQSIFANIPSGFLATAGTIPVTVVNPAPGGGASNTATFTVNNPFPALASISPTSAPVNSAVTITATGVNFVAGATLGFNGTSIAGTVSNNGTTLTANAAANLLSTVGVVAVTVTNPDPGSETSNPINFSVGNLVPTLSAISPLTAPVATSVTITATGTHFVTGASLIFNGTSFAGTVSNNGTSLLATVASTSLTSVGSISVAVSNPAPGGGSSNTLSFAIDDFTVSGQVQPITITAGATANFAVAFATQGGALLTAVNFSAPSLPPLATMSFAPANLAAGVTNSSTTFSVVTVAHTSSLSPPGIPNSPAIYVQPTTLFALVALALMVVLLKKSNSYGRRRSAGYLSAAALLLFCGALISACGGGGSHGPTINPASGTPAGTYPITVTATSGATTRSTTVTLIVQ